MPLGADNIIILLIIHRFVLRLMVLPFTLPSLNLSNPPAPLVASVEIRNEVEAALLRLDSLALNVTSSLCSNSLN